MSPVNVLYLGRTAGPLERLLSATGRTEPPVSVSAVPTLDAAIARLASLQADCLIWDIDCESNPEIERLFSLAPGLTVVVREPRSTPDCLEAYAPTIVRADDDSLVDAVRSTRSSAENSDSPPEVAMSLLDRSADRIARIDGDGTYRSVSDGLAAALDSSAAALVGTTIAETSMIDPEVLIEHGQRALQTGAIQRYVDEDHQYVFVPIGDDQFQLVVQDPRSETVSERVELSNGFIDTVLDRLSDIFFVFDFEGTFLHWNDRLTEVTGYSNDEIASMSPMDFFVQADYERVDAAMSEIVETGDATAVVRIRTRGGRLLPYEFTGSMVAREDGSPQYICGIARDISQRRRSERALRERQQALSNLIKNLPGVVYRYRNETGFPVEFMSEGCTALTGYSRERLESGEVSWTDDVIHPEDREELRADVQTALAEDEQYQTTYRIRTADGEIRWVREQGSGVDDPDGSVEYLDGYLTEVTDVVEIEEELRREKAFTESALDAQPDLFYVFSPTGEMLRWNDRFNEVTGYSDAEIESMQPTDFVASEDVPNVRNAIGRVATDHETGSIEATLVTEDDRHIPYEFTGSVIEDVGESVYDTREHDLYLCGTGRNISQRITAEQELEAAIEELERSNAELERFAYVASHDLKEPLRMIRSYLDLIQRRYEGSLDEDADEFITYAVDGAERMRRMIDDLLTYSRIGTDDITLQAVDPNEVIDRVLDSIRIAIEEENADVTVEDLPTVEGDAQQLGQLFQNLISNAIAYSGEAPPEIHVSATEYDDGWQFSVSDSGVGIDPDQIDEVFEIFSSGTVSSSTGIGLAICKKIVQQHGGEIWVESEPGTGSTFHFTISDTDTTDPNRASEMLDV
ncbi:PAS domain S-box protein [Halalkalicoccus jeotgali]|uniref:histidine kinase n=1 Tax=Halalkalicoccus jeotgali (strain DSM 18796 / CECT 7217 / JCM 14584 / KCTC 4019 / B3) TaxID=795797 RepID=D8J5Q1_HALJB|nr:PAS domain S-box protein [Halalkalicoccus jeotgali]ADJ13707.1 sensory transduction histidine kinase [Halalkalicoccus jeotgali B3]ELY34246.1 sensory transduction histidine kinase [Halalkalicoccus jeotgali B3]